MTADKEAPLEPQIAQILSLQALDQYIRRKEQDLHALKSQVIKLAEQHAVTAQEIRMRQQALVKWEGTLQQKEEELVQAEAQSSEKRLRLERSGGGEEFLTLQQEIEELEQSKVRLQTETALLRVQMATLRREIRRKQRERERLAAGIDTLVLQEYERIFARWGGVAVVELRAQACQGCHMRLPLQICYKIQASRGLAFCPHCHRILYGSSSEPSAPAFGSSARGHRCSLQ